jgi:hypothetical protein
MSSTDGGTMLLDWSHSLPKTFLGIFVSFALSYGHQTKTSRETDSRASLLTDVVREELVADSALGRQRVSLSNGILHIDFSPAMPLASFGSQDHYGLPMEALMRAMALRRDFDRAFGSDRFWDPPLEAMEETARRAIDSGGTADEASRASLTRAIDSRIDQLSASTLAFAQKRGLDLQAARDPVPGFDVEIHITPPDARIRFMPFLTYKECVALHTSLEDQWTDLTEGKHRLIGRYRYFARWGKGLGGDEESTFGVNGNTVVTFSPPRRGIENGK